VPTAARRAVSSAGRRAVSSAGRRAVWTAARRAVSSAGRTAARAAAGRAEPTPAPVASVAGRTAAPTRAVAPSAHRIEAPGSANVPRVPVRRWSSGPDPCGAGGPCRAGPLSSKSIRFRPSTHRRCSSPGRGRRTRAPTSNVRRPVESPPISGCPGHVRPAAWPGTRTSESRHRRMIAQSTIDRARASAAAPIAAAARAVR
jgi:hypothetical protein